MTVTTPAPSHDETAWQETLTGPEAGGLLSAALAADGAELGSWQVREIHARPGAETTVAYDVVARRRHDGTELVAHEHLFATSATARSLSAARGAAALGDGVVRLDDGERVVHVWRHPHDPALPGLAAGSVPAAVEERLRAAGADVTVSSLETVTYRPLRRAVLRARTAGTADAGSGTVYVKVVRPGRTSDLVRRHRLFEGTGALAAPAVLAADHDGVVLLAELAGPSLAEHLAALPAEQQATALDPAELLRVTEALPTAGVELSRRAPWADRLDQYVTALTARHGIDASRLGRVEARVGSALRGRDLGPVVTTHGDLHAANLILADARPGRSPRVAGVLDVDTLGPGHRVDDLACALAHLTVLPSLSPTAYDGVPRLVDRSLRAFDRVVDPVVLRARTAAVIVSLAVGAPDAVLAGRWVGLAEHLLARTDSF
ncbi:hypothetical protein GCM10009718_08770 [Isoptericola halotolerans]|uniref:Aminoglycoside phosphotransferase n=1 Tax=Isoptericola halotolerans TaxID=300560 RepID=A0ABX2A2V6_9MICO|nr:phosphotransferase [Isoptericola halotolerans]NOV96200.1 aminoglycoside phosphotransferase [Isoptericola halotolerans]